MIKGLTSWGMCELGDMLFELCVSCVLAMFEFVWNVQDVWTKSELSWLLCEFFLILVSVLCQLILGTV